MFQQCGYILEVFIPQKRRKNTNTRFGFIKFLKESAVEHAISNLNGTWCHDKEICVKRAHFDRSHDRRDNRNKEPIQPYRWPQPAERMEQHIAPQLKIRRAVATKIDQDWLCLCLVGICKNYDNLIDLEKSMVEANLQIPIIKNLRGSKIKLTFRSMAEKENFVWSSRACNNGPFEVVHEWSIHEANTHREENISFVGVPLHAWNEETFTILGDLWGKTLAVDIRTINMMGLEVGRAKISTEHKGIINQTCELKDKDTEALASTSHVAESDLVPQKLLYMKALQGSVEKKKWIA
ncbi:hypothetical protein U1Q18_010937 [Sarracenia purpurea var. burkii]